MKNTALSKIILPVLVCCLAANYVSAQTETASPKQVNFGYSQNPKTKAKAENSETANQTPNPAEEKPAVPDAVTAPPGKNSEQNSPEKTAEQNSPETNSPQNSPQSVPVESRSIASKTLEIAKRAESAAAAPTEIYKIGVGDVLFISLQNAPAKDSTYYTVLNDGTIDYPLAGEMVNVSGLTTEEVEDLLKQKVKLYGNPQIFVKVREHASHTITVLGLVEKAGEKFLQREAMPLFLVRAEAVVQARANIAVIKRANSGTETINLKDPKSDDVLIFPNDIVEFKADASVAEETAAPAFYYIGGNIVAAGQQDFHSGMTLTQAILASGGLKKPFVKKVVIRRKNQDGLLSAIQFDLDSIKNGKQPDPVLRAGDTIEITN